MDVKPYTLKGTRDQRFGEIIVVKAGAAEVYNTSGLNDCPAELWDSMDTQGVANELGAVHVQLNGPKFWLMDSQTVSFGETVSFGGIEARWAATLDVSMLQKEGATPYQVFMPKKTQKMVYDAGKLVYELVDPDSHAYAMQAHGPQFSLAQLAKLGDRLGKLPAGWSYRTRTLSRELVLDLGPDETIYGVGDEFQQYYTRIPDGA